MMVWRTTKENSRWAIHNCDLSVWMLLQMLVYWLTYWSKDSYYSISIAIRWFFRTVCNHFNQPINQSINQPINPSINPSINQSVYQSTLQSINPSINQSINQSIHHSINQSFNQSVNQSNNQSFISCLVCQKLLGTCPDLKWEECQTALQPKNIKKSRSLEIIAREYKFCKTLSWSIITQGNDVCTVATRSRKWI